MIEFLNFYLIPGVVLGSIYALGAIGVSLTFGILRFANFAHGETMTLGAYVTVTLILITGWHPLALLPAAMALTAAAVTIVYGTVPSTTVSSAPVTVIVCGVCQLSAVNETFAGAGVPSSGFELESAIVTLAVGFASSTMVNVAVPPASVVVSPLVGVTVTPTLSLSVLVAATSATVMASAGRLSQ